MKSLTVQKHIPRNLNNEWARIMEKDHNRQYRICREREFHVSYSSNIVKTYLLSNSGTHIVFNIPSQEFYGVFFDLEEAVKIFREIAYSDHREDNKKSLMKIINYQNGIFTIADVNNHIVLANSIDGKFYYCY